MKPSVQENLDELATARDEFVRSLWQTWPGRMLQRWSDWLDRRLAK